MSSPRASVLVRALTTDPPDIGPEDVPDLVAAGLGGEVRARLPQGHPLRAALRPEQLAFSARHASIRAEVRPLLRAWAREGIPCLLFKGFALAEFEYATAGERAYGDVDVLFPDDPVLVTRAVQLALAYGWRTDGLHITPQRWRHESAHLFNQYTRLDIHRFALAWKPGTPQGLVRALTQSVWDQAQQVDWEGIIVYRPDPRDALVVNLALARQWGGDLGTLKPADYADARLLIQRHQLSAEALETRARQVGGTHTWAAFQQVCNPPRRRFGLGEDIKGLLRTAARRDGKHPRSSRWHLFWWAFPTRLKRVSWMLRLLPDAVAAGRAIRAGGDPRLPLVCWTPRSLKGQPSPDTVADVIASARVLTRLLYPRSRQGGCLPRAYITYRALQRLGYPAVFVSGIVRGVQGLQGHAWIEAHGGTLESYGEPMNRLHYKEVFHYPE